MFLHKKNRVFLCIAFMFTIQCVTPKTYRKNYKKPTATSAQQAKSQKPRLEQCSNPALGVRGPTPFYVEKLKTFITAFTSHCNDTYLVEKDSDWAAMRLPCTEGLGSIDIKGSVRNPKHVGFAFNIGCGFAPADKVSFEKTINSRLGLTQQSVSLAVNPLSVQYWEVEGTNDADVGHVVKLRTYAGLDKYSEFEKGKPLVAHLYGRENAWGAEHNFYHYKVELKPASYKKFRIEILEANALDDDDKRDIAQRCRQLKPKRNCHLTF